MWPVFYFLQPIENLLNFGPNLVYRGVRTNLRYFSSCAEIFNDRDSFSHVSSEPFADAIEVVIASSARLASRKKPAFHDLLGTIEKQAKTLIYFSLEQISPASDIV